MKFSYLIVFVTGLVSVKSQEFQQDVTCPTCMHMSFKLSNVPDMLHGVLNRLLSGFSKPSCLTSDAEKMICAAPSSSKMINKCLTTTVNLRAVGMRNSLPDAMMNATFVIKNCVPKPIGEPDKCTNFKDMDAETVGKMTEKLQSVKRQWRKVDLNGHVCISGGNGETKTIIPVGNQTPTPKPVVYTPNILPALTSKTPTGNPGDVSCATCMHMSFTLSNVPDSVKSVLNRLLSGLSKPSCITSNAEKMVCAAQSGLIINKCQTTTVNLRAVGMRNSFSNAIMNATFIIRSCIPQSIGEPDKCTDFKDMDAETVRQMTVQLRDVERQWRDVKVQGHVCINGEGKMKVPTDSQTNSFTPTTSSTVVRNNKNQKGSKKLHNPANSSTSTTVSFLSLIFIISSLIL